MKGKEALLSKKINMINMRYVESNLIVKNYTGLMLLSGLVQFFLNINSGNGLQAQTIGSTVRHKPNILIILADDLGYSDIGNFGSEIHTPNLDQLAENGLRMTRFYNNARCSPSRASLLTGLYPHQAGIGILDSDLGIPEYQGYLNNNSVTMAEVLQDAGYSTYMSGKWHIGINKGHWPLDRGFKRYFGLIEGSSNFYTNINFRDPQQKNRKIFLLDNKPYEIIETTEEMWKRNEGFHMTDAFTDYALKFLDDHKKQKPFFLYVSYTAPHWPLHAFPKDIDRYRDRYKSGWDSLKLFRYNKQIELGIIDESIILSPNSEWVKSWESADEQRKKEWPLEMAIYAAMIDHMDRNIGRLIEKLKEMGQFENTLILFFSDNGGCHTTPSYSYLDGTPGGQNSFPTYGYEGAEVSNVPFRMWKQFIHEGGIASPFIAHYPNMIAPGIIDRQVAHIIDLMSTIVALTGAEYPIRRNGNAIKPIQGVSLIPAFEGNELVRKEPIYFEHQGNRGIRAGEWKLVSSRLDLTWELYNTNEDPTELNDLSKDFPQIRNELIKKYEIWAEENNILSYPKLQKLMRAR